jgi:hypothetical protein
MALYKVTIAQPYATSRFIRMDTDIFNAGEVVEFVVANDGRTNLKSPNDHPEYAVVFQTSRGTWATKLGPEQPVVSNASFLKPGESSQVYRFLSEGWEAGRYRIVSDYGVEREILIRANPTPVPTPVCPPAKNITPWIAVDPVPDHRAGEPFTITGTTDVPAGTELWYTIFAPGTDTALVPLGTPVAIRAEEGTCGISRWSADVMLPYPGPYIIGITESTKAASAVGRFTILPVYASAAVTPAGSVPGTLPAIGTPVPPSPRL